MLNFRAGCIFYSFWGSLLLRRSEREPRFCWAKSVNDESRMKYVRNLFRVQKVQFQILEKDSKSISSSGAAFVSERFTRGEFLPGATEYWISRAPGLSFLFPFSSSFFLFFLWSYFIFILFYLFCPHSCASVVFGTGSDLGALVMF